MDADEIEGAQAANAEAQSTLAAYNEKIAGAESEAAALIAEAKNDASAAKDRKAVSPVIQHGEMVLGIPIRWFLWPNMMMLCSSTHPALLAIQKARL